ncbi:Cyanovirin-N [Coprinellus micaceus]|uniref:Cyanovirin-N n=1 Tax=Coprinellus micaceus TaxID=71717 RepID=A0A4Y7SIQ1_COPMI|nr:Cyanovirin-N [Coprinellus micaceus]
MDEGDPSHTEHLFQSAMMFKLRDGCVLTGLCHTHGGSWNLSEIHLDRYIANMWGSFVAGGSAFTRSSRNIRLEFQDEMGVLMLRVELGDGKGNWNTSQLDLTGYIIVKDGCFVFEKRAQQRNSLWLNGPMTLSAHDSLVATVISNLLKSDCEWQSRLARISDSNILSEYAEAPFGRPLTETLMSMVGDEDTGCIARQYVGRWFSTNGHILVGTIATRVINGPCTQRFLNGVWKAAPWASALKSLVKESLSTKVSRSHWPRVAEIMTGEQSHFRESVRVQEDVKAQWDRPPERT